MGVNRISMKPPAAKRDQVLRSVATVHQRRACQDELFTTTILNSRALPWCMANQRSLEDFIKIVTAALVADQGSDFDPSYLIPAIRIAYLTEGQIPDTDLEKMITPDIDPNWRIANYPLLEAIFCVD